MPIDLKAAIRNALTGSSSQQPVDVATLCKFGKKVDIDAQIGLMLANRELNTAWTMKDGVQKTLCWLTGVISPLGSNMLVINRQRMESARDRPPLRTPSADLRTPSAEIRKNVTEVQKTVTDVQQSATEVKPNTAKVQETAVHQPAQKKEIPVNTTAKPHGGKQPSELNTAIYNKIVEHPGITQDALIKHAHHKCPDAPEKQIRKTMLNMVHATKKIRVEGERGNYTYHLNTGVIRLPAKPAKPAKPSKAVAAGKVVFGNEAAALRGDPQPAATPASSPVEKQEAEPEFELLLSDENCLHINLGGNRFRLNPKQLARLDTFLARVLTDGVRLADGAPA